MLKNKNYSKLVLNYKIKNNKIQKNINRGY